MKWLDSRWKWIKQKKLVLPLFLSFIVIYVIIRNIGTQDFIRTSFTTCFSLLLAVWVSYYLTQKQTDSRRQKELLLNLLYSLQELINDEALFKIPPDYEMSKLTLKVRAINNRISLIERYKEYFGISEDVDFIIERMDEYNLIIGENFNNTEYLSIACDSLFRPLSLINDKIFDITLKIYM